MHNLQTVPLSQGSSYTSNQFAQWQTSNHDENANRSLQDSEIMQQKEENLSGVQSKRHDTDSPNQQQKNDSSQEINSLPLQHISQDSHQTTEAEQENTLHSSGAVNMQNPEKNMQNPESPHLNLQGANNLQSMQSLTTGTSGLPRVATEASNQSESATGSSSQAAINVVKQGKQVPFAMLFPHIQPQLDKDRAMQLQTLYLKLKVICYSCLFLAPFCLFCYGSFANNWDMRFRKMKFPRKVL